jgi:hypothetical protein
MTDLNKPTRPQVTAWIRDLPADADKCILEAVALIANLRSEYATSAQLSAVRAVARELLFVTVRDNREDRASRLDIDTRFNRATSIRIDPTGEFHSGMRKIISDMRERNDAWRAEYRATMPEFREDNRSALERAYDGERKLAATLYELSRAAR